MLLVAFGTALATGVPVEEVVPVMQTGMGNTLSSVMIVVGLGAMLGRLIEVAGGADALAQKFTQVLGENPSGATTARGTRRARRSVRGGGSPWGGRHGRRRAVR